MIQDTDSYRVQTRIMGWHDSAIVEYGIWILGKQVRITVPDDTEDCSTGILSSVTDDSTIVL